MKAASKKPVLDQAEVEAMRRAILALSLLLCTAGCAQIAADYALEGLHETYTILKPRPVCSSGVDPAAVTWCRVEKPR